MLAWKGSTRSLLFVDFAYDHSYLRVVYFTFCPLEALYWESILCKKYAPVGKMRVGSRRQLMSRTAPRAFSSQFDVCHPQYGYPNWDVYNKVSQVLFIEMIISVQESLPHIFMRICKRKADATQWPPVPNMQKVCAHNILKAQCATRIGSSDTSVIKLIAEIEMTWNPSHSRSELQNFSAHNPAF